MWLDKVSVRLKTGGNPWALRRTTPKRVPDWSDDKWVLKPSPPVTAVVISLPAMDTSLIPKDFFEAEINKNIFFARILEFFKEKNTCVHFRVHNEEYKMCVGEKVFEKNRRK